MYKTVLNWWLPVHCLLQFRNHLYLWVLGNYPSPNMGKRNLHFKQAHLLESQIMHSSHQSVTKQSSETDFVLRRDEKIVTITTRTVVILQNDCVGERFQFLLPVGYTLCSFLWLEKFLWKYLSMFEHNDTPTHSLENGSADNGLIVERICHGAPSVENDMFTLRYTWHWHSSDWSHFSMVLM